MMTRTLGMVSSGMEDPDLILDLGISNTMVMPLQLKSGDKIMFDIVSEGRRSGLLNSDSRILRVTGYRMDDDALGENKIQTIYFLQICVRPINNQALSDFPTGFACNLADFGTENLRLRECSFANGFVNLENAMKVTIPKTGNYRIAMGADVISRQGSTVHVGIQDSVSLNCLNNIAGMVFCT